MHREEAVKDVIKPKLLAERWDTTEGALAQQRYKGTGPVFIRVGKRTVLYRLADVLAYEEAQRFTRTDTPVGAA
jgi:hypothetical protein